MLDCPDGEIRDLLPDLVHERLDAAERDRVKAHATGCADCTAEIALLARIRASADNYRTTVDVARVVSALPRAGRSSRRWSGSFGLRIAAGFVVLIAGATWIQQTQRSPDAGTSIEQPVVVAQVPSGQGAESARSVVSGSGVNATSPTATRAKRQVSLDDDLAELSDGELTSLLGALDSFEAVTGAEPATLEPILESESLR